MSKESASVKAPVWDTFGNGAAALAETPDVETFQTNVKSTAYGRRRKQ